MVDESFINEFLDFDLPKIMLNIINKIKLII